jgi:hypothetical protein
MCIYLPRHRTVAPPAGLVGGTPPAAFAGCPTPAHAVAVDSGKHSDCTSPSLLCRAVGDRQWAREPGTDCTRGAGSSAAPGPAVVAG